MIVRSCIRGSRSSQHWLYHQREMDGFHSRWVLKKQPLPSIIHRRVVVHTITHPFERSRQYRSYCYFLASVSTDCLLGSCLCFRSRYDLSPSGRLPIHGRTLRVRDRLAGFSPPQLHFSGQHGTTLRNNEYYPVDIIHYYLACWPSAMFPCALCVPRDQFLAFLYLADPSRHYSAGNTE